MVKTRAPRTKPRNRLTLDKLMERIGRIEDEKQVQRVYGLLSGVQGLVITFEKVRKVSVAEVEKAVEACFRDVERNMYPELQQEKRYGR